ELTHGWLPIVRFRTIGRPGARTGSSVHRRATSYVGVDGKRRIGAEARAIDLKVLHHALDVVAGLHERNALDPVDRIDFGIARVAEPLDPLVHAPAPGVVG